MSERILVVDDDRQLTAFLERYLLKQGYDVVSAYSAAQMSAAMNERKFDLLVLDIGLPDRDGFKLTRELRQTSNIPIVVLTARDEVIDRVVGLELGADDYVTKPFEPRELFARIKSVLRRSQQGPTGPILSPALATRLCFADFTLDLTARTLMQTTTGEDIKLTSTEFSLLKALVENSNTVLSRARILDLVYGGSTYLTDRVIDAHIVRLRRKMETRTRDSTLIKTAHGTGYVFAAEPSVV